MTAYRFSINNSEVVRGNEPMSWYVSGLYCRTQITV